MILNAIQQLIVEKLQQHNLTITQAVIISENIARIHTTNHEITIIDDVTGPNTIHLRIYHHNGPNWEINKTTINLNDPLEPTYQWILNNLT